MPEIVVVEGLDGVGKTTTVQALVVMTGGVDVTNELAIELGASRRTVMKATSAQARCHYWLAVNYLAGERAAAHVADGRTAIIDSYFFRTIVSHSLLGVALDWAAIGSAAIAPDRAVVLTVSEDVRRTRLRTRGEADVKPQWHFDLNSEHALVRQHYQRFGLFEIDTTISPQKVAATVLADERAKRFRFVTRLLPRNA